MIRTALLIAHKDLKIILTKGAGLSQALLLGLLMVFLFSLSLQIGDRLSPNAAATMFWLSSIFCQVLIFQILYAFEEQNKTGVGLKLLPAPCQAVWLGKFLAGLLLLILAQSIFVPAMFIFLNQNIGLYVMDSLIALFLTNIGICACGSLLGALSLGQSGRESILSIILFPLLIPLLLAAIRLTSLGLENVNELQSVVDSQDILRWHGLAVAFDLLFCALGLILFPFLYSGDE